MSSIYKPFVYNNIHYRHNLRTNTFEVEDRQGRWIPSLQPGTTLTRGTPNSGSTEWSSHPRTHASQQRDCGSHLTDEEDDEDEDDDDEDEDEDEDEATYVKEERIKSRNSKTSQHRGKHNNADSDEEDDDEDSDEGESDEEPDYAAAPNVQFSKQHMSLLQQALDITRIGIRSLGQQQPQHALDNVPRGGSKSGISDRPHTFSGGTPSINYDNPNAHLNVVKQFVYPGIHSMGPTLDAVRQFAVTLENEAKNPDPARHNIGRVTNSDNDFTCFEGSVEGRSKSQVAVRGKYDTGAEDNFVATSLINRLGWQQLVQTAMGDEDFVFVGIDSRVFSPIGRVYLAGFHGSRSFSEWFYVMDAPPYELILGSQFIIRHQVLQPSQYARVKPVLPLRRAKGKAKNDVDRATKQQRYDTAAASRNSQQQGANTGGQSLRIDGRSVFVKGADIESARRLKTVVDSGRATYDDLQRRAETQGAGSGASYLIKIAKAM